MDMQVAAGWAEYKFVDAAGKTLPDGEFRGYLAVFGNEDSHGDVIAPGAFADTIAQRKAQDRHLPMHAMHGVFGGDGLPIGVFKDLVEDEKGLRVHGKISGIKTEAGQLHYERAKDGAYGGLSIGYKPVEVKKGSAGGPKRTLIKIDLREGSLVDHPSNALARIDEMKRARSAETRTILQLPNAESAAAAVKACLDLHGLCLGGNDTPTADERAAFLAHLEAAYGHLTGGSGKAAKPDGATIASAFGFLSDFSIARAA